MTSNTTSVTHCVSLSGKGSAQGETELLGLFHAFMAQDINCLLLAYIKTKQTYLVCFLFDVTCNFARARIHAHTNTHTQRVSTNFD